MTRRRPFYILPKKKGRPAAVPSADRKSTVADPLDMEITPAEEAESQRQASLRAETAMWLSNSLQKPFPVEDVHPGHVANYLVWKAHYGR